jgi:hypothetical protein
MSLADAADDEGVCWPSIPTLARKCCISTRTVQRSLDLAPTLPRASHAQRQLWRKVADLCPSDESAQISQRRRSDRVAHHASGQLVQELLRQRGRKRCQ